MEALQGFRLGRPDTEDRLAAAIECRDPVPGAARSAGAELAVKLLHPPMVLLRHCRRRDHEEFARAPEAALRQHKAYWSAPEERAISAEGYLALGPLALACLACDAGFPLDIESPYLPRSLLAIGWAGEINLTPGPI